jgi:hypothetical protein
LTEPARKSAGQQSAAVPPLAALIAEVRFWRGVFVLYTVLLLVLLAVLRAGGCHGPVRAILVDGQPVCYVPDERTAEQIKQKLIEQATAGLPGPAALKERWEVVRPQVTPVDEAVQRLRRRVHVQVESWGIEVDGTVLAYLPDETQARQLLQKALARFTPREGSLVAKPRFKEQVRLVRAVLAPEKVVRDPDRALDRLLTQRPGLTVVTVQELQVRKPVPPPEEVTATASLPAGQRQVVSPGEPGEKLVSLRAEFHNGRRVRAQVLKEFVIKRPQPRKVLVGTGPAAPEAAPSGAPTP